MREFIIFNITISLLVLCYLLAFRRLSFYRVNRWYLLSIPVVSVCISLFRFNIESTAYSVFVSELPAIAVVPETVSSSDFSLWTWVYWSGVVFTGGVFLFQLGLVLIKNFKSEKDESGRYLSSPGNHAFSFLSWVNLGERLDDPIRPMVYHHEDVHRKEWHSLDVLLYQCTKIFCWFNPFIHLALREVQSNHEFIADQSAYDKFGMDYQHAMLNEAMGGKVYALTHSFFNYSLLKQRIMNMNRKTIKTLSKMGLCPDHSLVSGTTVVQCLQSKH